MVNCRFLGNACIELVGERDHIIIDPNFISAPTKGIEKILVTHHHKDHIENDTLQKIQMSYLSEGIEFEMYGPECLYDELDLEFILILPGSNIELNNGNIQVFENKCWKAEGCVAYLISIDNKKILHTADSSIFSKQLKSIKDQIDLCFIACFTENFQDYLDFLNQINAKLVIPYHFTPKKQENARDLVQFLKDNGLESNFLSIGQEMEL